MRGCDQCRDERKGDLGGGALGEPVGLWRRRFADLIDGAICALLRSLLAPMLYAAIGGRRQYVPDVRSLDCRVLTTLPADCALPPDFVTGLSFAPFGLAVAFRLWADVSILRRWPTVYDRPVGTDVVRV